MAEYTQTKDKMFREWYDARTGTKSESFAYDVWCAAWECSRLSADMEVMSSLMKKKDDSR
jgi:hypothetical protein